MRSQFKRIANIIPPCNIIGLYLCVERSRAGLYYSTTTTSRFENNPQKVLETQGFRVDGNNANVTQETFFDRHPQNLYFPLHLLKGLRYFLFLPQVLLKNFPSGFQYLKDLFLFQPISTVFPIGRAPPSE